MATKPTDTPRWATNGGATLEPSSGRKDTGWEVSDKPPARFTNWLFNTIYGWIEYLRDNQFSSAGGISPFAFDDDVNVTGEVETDRLLVTQGAAFTDRGESNVRSYVDANGYRAGLVIERQWAWGPINFALPGTVVRATIIPSEAGTTIDSTNGRVDILPPGTGLAAGSSFSFARLRLVTAEPKIVIHLDADSGTDLYLVHDLNDVVVTIEWLAYLSDVLDEHKVFLGLHGAPISPAGSDYDDETANDFAMFTYDPLVSANWRARSADNTTLNDTDTTVAPVINTWQTFRIEYHGSATPRGVANSNAPVAEFWIDGTSRATHTANLPIGGIGLGPTFVNQGNGAPANLDICLGPVWMRQNAILASYRAE